MYCYSNLDAIYAKGLLTSSSSVNLIDVCCGIFREAKGLSYVRQGHIPTSTLYKNQ